jgi:hypothetical protein
VQNLLRQDADPVRAAILNIEAEIPDCLAMVDLDIAYSPVLPEPGSIHPVRVTALENGNYRLDKPFDPHGRHTFGPVALKEAGGDSEPAGMAAVLSEFLKEEGVPESPFKGGDIDTWNIPADVLRIMRARFLLSRPVIQDAIVDNQVFDRTEKDRMIGQFFGGSMFVLNR